MNANITILCRVIDNYGDIGVVYRLARALEECGATSLRLIVDDLVPFSLLEPQIAPDKDVQQYHSWHIYRWQEESPTYLADFEQTPSSVVIECFACGRPDWFDALLFNRQEGALIINLEYLTAERYADEFHGERALTRSAAVRKYFFMPGFTPKTGGLIIDKTFARCIERRTHTVHHDLTSGAETFRVVLFNYGQYAPAIVQALASYQAQCREVNSLFSVRALAAAGKSQQVFIDAHEHYLDGSSFTLEVLPFMNQLAWDELLSVSDFLFVRGEDSLARACLLGIPFVWQAYPQTEQYQLVKVRALLEAMQPFFAEDDFALVEKCFLLYNDSSCEDTQTMCSLFVQLFSKSEGLRNGFASFAGNLQKNGNLASNLMTFISKNAKLNC